MSRYLTPSKIGLLALISLYTDSFVPTSASVPVLSFIVSHILPTQSTFSSEKNARSQPHTLTIDELQNDTIKQASGIPGRTIWDLLLKKLWDINSLDALNAFFDNLGLLLAKTREEQHADLEEGFTPPADKILLSRNSPFGVFVRRAQLEFTRLQFHDGISLWKSYIAYREPTMALWKRRNPDVERNSIDANLVSGRIDLSDPLAEIMYGDVLEMDRHGASVSTDDVEKLLEFQVDQMQKMGSRIPDGMKAAFEEMVAKGVTVPSLSHYVKFLDSWKAGDYPSSFDNLHRYFDYTMHNRDRTFYQYALLNLAILQADFGCYHEAVAAMHETISTARENKDMACLNYSLSWLYHFGKAHPEELGEVQRSGVLGTEKEALAFLKAKAKETSMWSLLSTSLLSEAKSALASGDSIPAAFESIIKASHLNVTKYITNAMGNQLMMQASIFGRLGVSCLAWSYNEIFMQCYSESSPIEDALHCVCKSAQMLAQRGQYAAAAVLMDEVDVKTLHILKHQQYWMAHSGILSLQRKLYHGDLDAAQHFLSQLKTSAKLIQDLFFTTSVLEVHIQIRRQNYTAAMELLEKQFNKLSDVDGDIFQRIKLMILKARVYDKAGVPQKGFSVALRAATLAHKARLLPVLWEAVGAISRVLISVREFSAAANLLESVMPQVLECEDCELAANSYSYLADAHMGMAGDATPESSKRKEEMTRALGYINRSFDEFSRIEDVKAQCEMLAKKATIMHLNGDLVLANDCAAKYLDILKASKENEAFQHEHE